MSLREEEPTFEDFLSDLNNQDWEVRYNAAGNLGYLGNPTAVEYLYRFLKTLTTRFVVKQCIH